MTSLVSGVRFAPSPTGRFHIGNLRTAWISREWALALGESWTVRFEDIDSPRVVLGAREAQLGDMAFLGMLPDFTPLQSERHERHFDLFLCAAADDAIYPCFCSRKEVSEALAGFASAPHSEVPLYSGHCRDQAKRNASAAQGTAGVAWRFKGADPSGLHDFIIARTKDRGPDPESFVPAYHWACAIDDYDGNYRLLVRAADLASSTPLQRSIQAWISRREGSRFVPAAVFHTSLVTRNDGHRLEKRTEGVTLPELLSAGWTLERILSQFRKYFEVDSSGLQYERIFGEPERERTLASLGF